MSSEYPPEPTQSYEDQQPGEGDYDPYGPAPTQVTMITEDAFPYVTTTESHYAKEDTETMQVGQLSAGRLYCWTTTSCSWQWCFPCLVWNPIYT